MVLRRIHSGSLHWAIAYASIAASLICVIAVSQWWQGPNTTRHILILAGRKSEGPEGNGTHDYLRSAQFLKQAIENSNIAEAVEVNILQDFWSNSTDAFHDADSIVVLSDGRDGTDGREALHIGSDERVRLFDVLNRRGCGLVVLHQANYAPDRLAESVLDLTGGYFDWETDDHRNWYSDTVVAGVEVSPTTPRHPVLRGVKPFELREEFGFDVKFRTRDPRWTPIWTVEDLPATKPNGHVVAWAYQRSDQSRAFATTCGHYYDSWMVAGFRKTILNAIAWTARVELPEGGVDVSQPSLVGTADSVEDARTTVAQVAATPPASVDPYEGEPHWYVPGHPISPADPAGIKSLPGFLVERVYDVPEEQGSWTALAVDEAGRLIASAQHLAGLYRVTLPNVDDATSLPEVNRLGGAAEAVGRSQGLLCAFDSLYVTVSEGADDTPTGIYRLQDTTGDDQYDVVDLLIPLESSGEHGAHNLLLGPDGKSIYLICGNGTPLPRDVVRRLVTSTTGKDHLMPPSFDSSTYTTAGYVCRFGPEGEDIELVCGGLRNCYDLAFNLHGDLFTFDSDMEWDLGTPWYRPTRICQVVSGGEYGWRADAAKWPEYFEDSVPPVHNVGPSSPTGITFGYGTRFPHKYQACLFACDWTFATVYAVHLSRSGAGYRAEVEEFIGGKGLPVTDICVGKDGALYFAVGGRRLGSALYRVRYVGDDSTDAAPADTESTESNDLHALRRRLESLHGREDGSAVTTAWPYLGHEDRLIRFAARIAIEHQPVESWRVFASEESNDRAQSTALLALARQCNDDDLKMVIDSLNSLDFSVQEPEVQLTMLRAYELALARGGDNFEESNGSIRQVLAEAFPTNNTYANRELARILCCVGEQSVIAPMLELMERDTGEEALWSSELAGRNAKYGEPLAGLAAAPPLVDRMHFAQMLLWIDGGWTPEQREEYFRLITKAKAKSATGVWYTELWDRIRDTSLQQVPAGQAERLQELILEWSRVPSLAPVHPPRGPGREWTLPEVLDAVEIDFHGRSFENGRQMYSAAMCASCHRFNGEGNSIGPDLSSVGNRFTVKDIVDAIVNPSKAISEQYQMQSVKTRDQGSIVGRMVSRDDKEARIATNVLRPSQTTIVSMEQVESIEALPVSTMPQRLLSNLNQDELLDLLAFLISGGDATHSLYQD